MEDIRLPRHLIERIETRWATLLQQGAKAWSDKQASVQLRCQTRSREGLPGLVAGSPARCHALGGELERERPKRIFAGDLNDQ
jgi:hypothetical protein